MGTTIPSDIAKKAEGAVYTTIGLGVMGFQRVQVQRQQLRKTLTSGFADLTSAIDNRATTIDERLDDLGERIDGFVDDIELPGPARAAAKQACALAREARHQVFGLFGGPATTT